MKYIRPHRQHGQALVVLLVFMVVAIIMTTMAVAIVIINAQEASAVEEGDMALKLSESGVEDALLRILRNPSYIGSETLTINNGTVTATVSAGNPIGPNRIIIITSKGSEGTFARETSVSAMFQNTVLTIVSWKEIF